MPEPSPIRSISVLMPTWQGAAYLERVLASLAAQEVALPWDFLAVDSGSSDGTLAILEGWRARLGVPMRVLPIHKEEFDHGDTRNLLAARSRGDLLVFLTQDAIPSSREGLATLAANFADPAVGAAYCRNLPRADAEALTKLFSEQDPGYQPGRREVRLPEPATYAALSAHEKRLLYNFNDVASAIRRELWERHPFPRTEFGEDVLMARALLEAGWTVVYDDRATVEHSHDYSAAETVSRARIDGRFNAEWLDRTCVASAADAAVLAERQLARDREGLVGFGLSGEALEHELERARELRRAAFLGLHEGGLSRRRFPPTALLERTKLHVLFVVHGFPPDTWAGTEVYTLSLAVELEKLGHRCTVLARAGAERSEEQGGPADFSLALGEFQGLRVWRMTHRIDHRSLRESYDEPRAVEAFHEVLLRERPDLVHFQHLLHTSTGLVHEAREFNLPTLLHCHDYWGLCARVQLIRPDGVRCDENQELGCLLCVKEKDFRKIPPARTLLPAARPLAAAARFVEAHPGGRLGRLLRRRRSAVGRWGRSYDDMRRRQDVVLGAYAAADLLISPSRFLCRKLLETSRLEPDRLVFSDNGLRAEGLRAVPRRSDPQGMVRFGFVGSLVWYKGPDVLLEAMRRLAGRRAALHVHGDFRPADDPFHARLQRLAEGSAVTFHGRFANERLAEVHAGIDVLVVPSVWYENAPISIREAFLLGTPVVTSDIGGMAESVRDGVDGLHFKAGDPDDLARVLARFLDEPGLAAELASHAPPVKTIPANAREMEFRYRALCCVRRERRSTLLYEYAGNEAAERAGPVEPQGRDMLLLRPGGAWVEYDVSLAGPGLREVHIGVLALGGERSVPLAGRALLDGREIGRIEPFTGQGADETKSFTFAARFPAGARRLRLDTRSGPGEAYLRVARVEVRDGAPAREAPLAGRATAEARA
ncbi:MAG TPA: glycosyltransferase [Planctomycetota bacterium]|nr:glycosyltransferase [Planctomycetota bacterium]